MPLIVVGALMSPHRIVQMIRARNSVTVSVYSLAAACSWASGGRYAAKRAGSHLSRSTLRLDQEQTAAAMYADTVTELERWLPDSDPDRGSEPRATCD